MDYKIRMLRPHLLALYARKDGHIIYDDELLNKTEALELAEVFLSIGYELIHEAIKMKEEK